jgi:rRNA-processing protein FCF1
MEKVIFDTNLIRNIDAKTFLGGRQELEKFAKVARLVFPDIVIEEIKRQKRRKLKDKKRSFLDNPFHWLKELDRDETSSFDIEAHISSLEESEELEYDVIKLTDYSILEQMKELALNKRPPFEAGEGTDKGFKDTYIYFTVLEYLQAIPDKTIFVCTKDGKLKEAFEKHPNIIVVQGYADFIENSSVIFYDDYFIGKLKAEVHSAIGKESIINYWVNINENQVLLVRTDDGNYVVEIDSGEIVATDHVDAYAEAINNLINSGSFASTHSAIGLLHPYIHFLSDDEITRILEATSTNEQIYWIINDEDVKQFIGTLYESKKGILSSEIETMIEELLSQ